MAASAPEANRPSRRSDRERRLDHYDRGDDEVVERRVHVLR